MGRGGRAGWAWLAVGFVLGACDGGAAPGAPCDVSADCRSGLDCAFGRCRAACDEDRDCLVVPDGIDAATGVGAGRCVVDTRGARGCTLAGRDDRCLSAADCPSGLVCHEGECRNGCGESECPAGMDCAMRRGARVCEWTALSDAGAATDGGDVTTGDAALPRLDAGVLPDAGSPSDWPERFPAECIPPPGEAIGAPCESDTDCASGICDRERAVVLPWAPSVTVVHSPGGTCAVARVDPEPDGRPSFPDCGPCARYVATPTGQYACADLCTNDGPLPRGGCREGYVCDEVTGVCVTGCVADVECNLARGFTGSTMAATCDASTGACVDPAGAGEVGDPCGAHADCGSELFCASGRLPDYHSRGACANAPDNIVGNFGGCPWTAASPGMCTRRCRSDGECPDGARCAEPPYYDSIAGRPAHRLCLRECVVGGEPLERRFGVMGAGDGCAPGLGCYPPGLCAPGTYNDVAPDMPNVGEACFAATQCWSPMGLGRCGEGGFFVDNGTCRVHGCSHPALASTTCPPDAGVCVDDECRRACGSAEDCAGEDACSAEGYCDPSCASDDECRDGRSCFRYAEPDGTMSGRCISGGPPTGGGCGLTTVALDAPLDPDGWRRQIVRAPAAPTADLCGVGISADGVSFTAPADGRLEIEVTGEGHYLAGVLDFTRCDSLADPSLYDCDAPQTRSVRLVESQTVSFAIVGTPEVSTRRTELRYRFIEERGLGESCAGNLGCEPGLECGALGGADRCVPSPVCGEGIAVQTLDRVGAAQPDGSVRVLLDATGADRHAPSCQPGTGRSDLVLPLQSLQRERWIVEPADGTVWTRADCADAGTEGVCGAGGAPIVFDLAAGEAVHLMSEAATAHDLTIRRRTLLGPGGSCAVMSMGAVPGVQCEPGTFCELDIWGNGTCSAAGVGCGAGVGRTLLSTLPVGTSTLRVDTRFAPPPPSFSGDRSALCDAPASEAVAILELRVEERSSLELRNVLRAGSDTSPTWTLRSACDAPVQTPCGQRLLERDSPLLEPGVTYYLLAFHPEPIEGTLEVVARLRPVQGPGEPCGGAFDDCHGSLVCGGGTCRAPVCGDGAREGYEQCDDGGTAPGDGCDDACRVEGACGNGRLEPGEECDDTNADDGDGCSSACVIEFSADGGGDGCGDAQRLTLVPVGDTDVARGRVVRAGATDRMTPTPLPPLTCNVPPEPGAVDRVFIVEGHAGDAVRPIGTRGSALFYNRLAITCDTGPDANCARAAMGDGATGCVTLPEDGDYIVVAEPMTDVFEFDIVLNGCTPP